MSLLKIIGWIGLVLILAGVTGYHLTGTGENEVGASLVLNQAAWQPGPHCQIGLTALEYITITDQGTCNKTTDAFVCTKCGNGTCEGGRENFCNCPADCSP